MPRTGICGICKRPFGRENASDICGRKNEMNVNAKFRCLIRGLAIRDATLSEIELIADMIPTGRLINAAS